MVRCALRCRMRCHTLVGETRRAFFWKRCRVKAAYRVIVARVRSGRGPWERAVDLAGIDKVAAANATATRLVEMPGVSVDFDYKHHPVFATVVVRREKKKAAA